MVAVRHEGGEVARYVFVVGDKEQLGGDLTLPFKKRSHCAPVWSAAASAPSFLGLRGTDLDSVRK